MVGCEAAPRGAAVEVRDLSPKSLHLRKFEESRDSRRVDERIRIEGLGNRKIGRFGLVGCWLIDVSSCPQHRTSLSIGSSWK